MMVNSNDDKLKKTNERWIQIVSYYIIISLFLDC